MRIIDADALKETIASNVYPVADAFNSRNYGMFWTGGIEKAIDEQPTIDAVEVVRCKDCKHRQEDTIFHKLYCDGREVVADWYCGDAERRSDDGV